MKQMNNLKKQCRYTKKLVSKQLITYIYSPREGTPAAKMEDNIPMEVKKERLATVKQTCQRYVCRSDETI